MDKRKQKKPELIDPGLPPEEWDFREIKEDWEMPFAVMYEYCRSSSLSIPLRKWFELPFSESGRTLGTDDELLLRLGIDWSEARDTSTGKIIESIWNSDVEFQATQTAMEMLSWELSQVIPGRNMIDIALRFPRFPEPWVSTKRCCGKDYLQKRCTLWARNSPPLREIEPLSYADSAPHANPYQRHDFIIDWSADAREIKRYFAEWLKEKHPATRIGRRATWEFLKWLSAYRLSSTTRRLNFNDAKAFLKTYTDENPVNFETRRVFPDLDSQTAWDDAVRRAERYLTVNFCSEILKECNHLWTP